MTVRWRPRSRTGVGSLLVASAAFVHLVPGVSSWRQMRCRLTPRLAGVGAPDHVALTFDDGPDPASTPAFLDELDRLGWQATFFVLGAQVRRHPELAAEMWTRGHELAVHGDRHVSHLRRPYPWVVADVIRARDAVNEITGEKPRWFRPPYGALSASSIVAARRADLQTILWTSWGRDWRRHSTTQTVVADVTRTLYPGATVLLHDSDITSAAGSWRCALEALAPLAERWETQGLRVGPLRDHGLAHTRTAATSGRP